MKGRVQILEPLDHGDIWLADIPGDVVMRKGPIAKNRQRVHSVRKCRKNLLLRPFAELSGRGYRCGVGKHLMEHPGVNFGCSPETPCPAAGGAAAADVRRAALVVRS